MHKLPHFQHSYTCAMSTSLGPSSMTASTSSRFFDLEEVEVLAKKKLPKPVRSVGFQHIATHIDGGVQTFAILAELYSCSKSFLLASQAQRDLNGQRYAFADRCTTTMLEERTQRALCATTGQCMGDIGSCRGTWWMCLTLTCLVAC